MGVGKILSRGATKGFFQNFCRGDQSGEICFFPLETKKTTFFCWIFKFQGEPLAFPDPPSDTHAPNRSPNPNADLMLTLIPKVKLNLIPEFIPKTYPSNLNVTPKSNS